MRRRKYTDAQLVAQKEAGYNEARKYVENVERKLAVAIEGLRRVELEADGDSEWTLERTQYALERAFEAAFITLRELDGAASETLGAKTKLDIAVQALREISGSSPLMKPRAATARAALKEIGE